MAETIINMDLVELITVTDQIKAEMIQQMLENNKIECLIQSSAAPSVHPFTVDGLAIRKIMVTSEDLIKAKEILADVDWK